MRSISSSSTLTIPGCQKPVSLLLRNNIHSHHTPTSRGQAGADGMDNMPRLASPQKRRLEKCSSSIRNTLNKGRKRPQPAPMDLRLPQARVARFDEPTFCPSSLLSLFPAYPSVIDLAPNFDIQASTYLGPPIDHGPPSQQPVTDSQAFSEAHSSSPARQRTPQPLHHGSRQQMQPRDSTFSWATHPPSPQIVSQTYQRTEIPLDCPFTSIPMLDGTRMDDTFRGTEASFESAMLASHERNAERPYLTHPYLSPDGSFQLPVDQAIAEDALSVDHPRHSYDFAEFMDNWRLQYLTNAPVPKFEPGSQMPSAMLGRASQRIMRRHLAERSLDWQGLKWDRLGSPREDALKARRISHPSRMQSWSTLDSSLASGSDGERRYHFRSFHSGHRAHSSHFQLRNLLAASNRSQIFYAAGSKVMATSLACPDVRTIAMDLSSTALTSAASMRVMCLSTPPETSSKDVYHSDKVLLAGGFSGEFALLDLTSQAQSPSPITTGFVSHHPNGIVTHIDTYPDRRTGLLRAAFSSNDHKLRLMDVKITSFTNTFSYAHAVNCSAISPDGRLRLLVGDSNKAYITNAETGDITTQLEGHNGHGFAAAWSASGTLVATGAQDDKVILWDARNWSRPLRILDTLMSCARSLHFTDDDAVVVAESEDVVSIYDARRSGDDERRQHLRFFGSIAGVCVLDGGSEIAVANADRTVGGLLTFERRWESMRGGSGDVRGWSRASRRHASLFCNDVML